MVEHCTLWVMIMRRRRWIRRRRRSRRKRRKKRRKRRRRHKKVRFTQCNSLLPKIFYFKDCHEI